MAPLLLMGAEPMSRAELDQRVEAVGGDVGLAEAWKEAISLRQQLDDVRAETQRFQTEGRSLIAELPELPTPLAPEAGLARHLKEVEQIKGNIETLRSLLKVQSDALEQAVERLPLLSEQVATVRGDLAAVQVPLGGGEALQQARRQQELLRKAWLEARVENLQVEKELLERRAKELPEFLGRVKERLAQFEDRREVLEKAVSELKQKKAEETASSLDTMAEKMAHIPAAGRLIRIIQDLNARQSGEGSLTEQLREASAFEDQINLLNERITSQEENARERIHLLEEAGLGIDSRTGLILREQRSLLPKKSELRQTLQDTLGKSAQARIASLELQERLARGAGLSEADIARLVTENDEINEWEIRRLLEQRREMLTSLVDDYGELNAILTRSIATTRTTVTSIDRYSTFLDERLLWIKSAPPLGLKEPGSEWRRLTSFFAPERIQEALNGLSGAFFDSPFLLIVLGAFSLIVSLKRRGLQESIAESSRLAARRNCRSITPTLKTIVGSALLAAAVPSVLVILGLLVPQPPGYRQGFFTAAIFLFGGSLIRRFSRPDGLLVNHFKVDESKASVIHRTLAWSLPLSVVLGFLVSGLTAVAASPVGGRLAFIAAMILAAVVNHLFLRPSTSILGEKDQPTMWIRIIYLIAVFTPLLLGVGAAFGFMSSVLILREKFAATLTLFILGYLVVAFFLRWILVSRRSLAVAQALKRREALLAEKSRQEDGNLPEGIPAIEEVQAEAVDVVSVETQTRQLVRLATVFTLFFGIWAIWSSVLPALSVLDKVTLWQGESAVEKVEEKPAAMPVPGATLVSPQNASASDGRVSLQDLILCFVYLVVTFLAARNLPGLLSLFVFNRIDMGPGGNFALTTTARYLIVLVGVVVALGKIDITWGKVQFLAAAITLGIGFGLQEIFANFVAGIILLFERPIRLGDVVTVGDVSGKVTKIQIRATTIRKFNSRELLVPNKEFITQQLVNWTLSDQLLRFEIPIGVAYGSDTRKVTEILMSLLHAHPKVLKDPEPQVIFTNFGGSSLDFEVRAHVGDIGDLLATQNELRYQIDDAFREAGIEIPFPQQDIHVRSMPGHS